MAGTGAVQRGDLLVDQVHVAEDSVQLGDRGEDRRGGEVGVVAEELDCGLGLTYALHLSGAFGVQGIGR